jgi:hypothetical protein
VCPDHAGQHSTRHVKKAYDRPVSTVYTVRTYCTVPTIDPLVQCILYEQTAQTVPMIDPLVQCILYEQTAQTVPMIDPRRWPLIRADEPNPRRVNTTQALATDVNSCWEMGCKNGK